MVDVSDQAHEPRIVRVIDSGLGNVRSVENAFRRHTERVAICSQPPDDLEAGVYVLPGVGSFDEGSKCLRNSGWDAYLRALHSENKSTIIGICLGMQLLCDSSDEGVTEGLHLIPGHFRKFQTSESGENIKVPHMGWNEVEFVDKPEAWGQDRTESSCFYFVHSYYYSHSDSSFVAGWTNHGIRFASLIKRNSVIGFQFHPEKSHKYGFSLFRCLL
jgi:glutamine amidotransferase